LRTALQALNQLVADGVIQNYAIGGAIGASFYLPAMQTEDLDVFIFLPPASTSLFVSLTPIYEGLKAHGGIIDREYIRFGDWPLQILTDATPLIAEAIREAIAVDFEGIPTRVFRAEHLCAIALQTGRTKDFARVNLFLEQGAVDGNSLSALTARHGLDARLRWILKTRQAEEDQAT
jgi:hypothetical protein